MRDEIFANQKRLGVIPENTQLTPWPDDLPKWDTLDADSKKMFARQAEVFAAYVAYADHEIGRVIDEVRRQGKLDNTLIIYIEGDNGTSAEGSTIGTAFDLAAIQAINMPVEDQLKYYDVWGGPMTQPHMSVAWSWAFDTPFKWTKQIASHFGGTRQGMVMSWPGHITDPGGVRSQFHHVIDIVPTILEATGIEAPQTVNGIAQKPIEGVSMAYTWSQGAEDVPSQRTTQYFEMFGDRAIYHDGWIASTTPPAGPWLMGLGKLPDVIDGYNWELYDLSKDFSQFDDLAAKEPDKLQRPAAALPRGGGEVPGAAAGQLGRRAADGAAAERDRRPGRVRLYRRASAACRPPRRPIRSTGPTRSPPRSRCPQGGGEGMLATLGGRFGGYGLYLLEGKPVFTYNLLVAGALPLGGRAGADPGQAQRRLRLHL